MAANGFENHGDSARFTFAELACLLTRVNFMPDTEAVLERIIQHLTSGKMGVAGTQLPGYFERYPGANLSVREVLCQTVIAQHEKLTNLSMPRSFPDTESATAWLRQKAQMLGYDSPETKLELAPLDHANVQTSTIIVVHDSDGERAVVLSVSHEHIETHELDPRVQRALPYSCIYYLEAMSLWLGSNFAVLVRPGSYYPYTEAGAAENSKRPFDREHPPITAELLKVPVPVPPQVPRHLHRRLDERDAPPTE